MEYVAKQAGDLVEFKCGAWGVWGHSYVFPNPLCWFRIFSSAFLALKVGLAPRTFVSAPGAVKESKFISTTWVRIVGIHRPFLDFLIKYHQHMTIERGVVVMGCVVDVVRGIIEY